MFRQAGAVRLNTTRLSNSLQENYLLLIPLSAT